MGAFVLGVRLLLAAVFGLAGAAKLLDVRGSARAVRDFGVPERLAAPAGLALPVAELAVAGALLVPASAWWATWAALALLVMFAGAIAAALARGETPDCHCFGQVHSSPAGAGALMRDLGLAVLAAFALGAGHAHPGASAVAWVGHLSAVAGIALVGGALVAAQAWFSVQLLRQNGRLLVRVEALEAGESGLAPEFSLPDLDRAPRDLASLRAAGKPVLLLFSDPACGPCNSLAAEVARWQVEHAHALTVAVVSRGSFEDNRAKAQEHGLGTVLVQRDREVAELYGARGTPMAVLVGVDGRVEGQPTGGAPAIRALVERIAGRPALPVVKAPSRPRVGDPVPELALRGLDGRLVPLADAVEARRTLLVFWNPSCGFCRSMRPDLAAWGRPDDLRLVVVSSATAEDLDFADAVLVDPDFEAGRAFGARGTPNGVLIDERGRVASEVTSGAGAVLALARGGDVVSAR